MCEQFLRLMWIRATDIEARPRCRGWTAAARAAAAATAGAACAQAHGLVKYVASACLTSVSEIAAAGLARQAASRVENQLISPGASSL